MQDYKNEFIIIQNELNKISKNIIEIGEPIKDDRISKFEKKYDLILPNDFKYFLSKINGLSLMGLGYFGITDDENEDLETVFNYENIKCQNISDLSIVPICNDGRGNYYCLDTRSLSDDKNYCNIIFWQTDLKYTNENMPDIESDNFVDWLKNIVIGWYFEEYDYNGNRLS
jgi:hypothetical protein